MKKRILSLILTFSILLSMVPLGALTAFAQDNILYGDADGNGKVELLDVNLMERYIEGNEEAQTSIHFTKADVNADGAVDDVDVQMVKDYLVGNLDSLTPVLHTITFVTDGGGDFAPIQAGDGYPYRGEIPTPAKDNSIFVNWAKEDGSVYYPLSDVISADMTLTAVYEPVESKEQLNITSFSLDDQPTDVSFTVTGDFAGAEEVKASIIVLPKDGSEPVAVEVEDNGDGTFTVYAPEGFNEGASYELTLGEGLYFADKEEMFRTAYFIIAKGEIDTLQYDADVIFIQDTPEMKYSIGGKTVDVLETALLSNDESTDAITGSFEMSKQKLEEGDIVCIYETTDPRNRDYTQSDYQDDAMAFISITAVNGSTYSFESLNEEDAEDVLAMPDSIPYQVATLPTGDGTVNRNDYDAYALSLMGETKAPEFEKYDFLIFYTVDIDTVDTAKAAYDADVVYAQVTNIDGDTIHYEIVEKEYIENYMDLFVTQRVDSEEAAASIDQEALLSQIEQQAVESGFAEEAANRMVQDALKTEDVQNKLLDAGITRAEIRQLSAAPAAAMAAPAAGTGSGRAKLTMERPTVNATFINDRHFEDGFGVDLNVSVVFSVDKRMSSGKIVSLKIELSAGFEQEVALDFDVDVDTKWKWYAFIPTLKDVYVDVSIDIYDYTGVSVGAKVYTVQGDDMSKKKWQALRDATASPERQELLRKINTLGTKVKKMQAKGENAQEVLEELDGYVAQLPKIEIDGVEYSIEQLEEALGAEDVSTAFDEVFSAETEEESESGMEQLMDRYKEMLEQECDWVEIYNQPLFSTTYYLAIVAVKVDLNFIVRANVNIALGADLQYQVGKRYSFWLHLKSKEAGSSEIDLIDEKFRFQFYVMGTLGLKAGVKAEIAFGLLSTSIASIGANVEFGTYLKLYGYFLYYFEKLRPANTDAWNETEEMLGALYVDFGLYVTVKFKAQVFLDLIKYEPTLYDGEFPLLTAGAQHNVYDFALEPDEDDIMYVRDEDINSTNGIAMPLSASYLTMKRMDLTTGEKTQSPYGRSNFIITFDNSNFKIDDDGVVSVDVPEGSRYLSSNMRIVWKSDKLAFSKYDIDITVPVVWTNMSQSELNEKFTASVAVGNETDGYQTVWSERYGRVDVFDLPTDDEILALIDYDSYTTEEGTNLKYAEIGGYREESTGLSLTTDKTYFFNVSPRTYSITVTGIQNADGTTETRTYTAKYGEEFDLFDLQTTGTVNNEERKYTRFLNLTELDAAEEADSIPLSMTADMAFVEKYGFEGVTFEANYLDTALTATYEFIGLGNNVPPVMVQFQSGTAPSYEGLADYVRQYGGENATIVSISPAQAPSQSSVTYTVVCQIDKTKNAYTLRFDTDGGSKIMEQRYLEGSALMQPTDPTREGYTFAGWYADEGCTKAFDFGAGMPGADTTVYAKWDANTYTITFVTSTGTAPEAMEIKYGDAYGELPVLTDAALRFMGWFTAASGGTQVTADTTFTGLADQTLYAHWEQKITIQNSWITITPRTENYDESEPGFPANFTVNAPDGDLKAEDFTVTYLWEKADAEWTEDAPVNAGGYLVKLSRAADDKYLAFELTTDQAAVVINKLNLNLRTPEVTISNWIATVDTSGCGIKGNGTVTYIMKRNYTTSDGYDNSAEVDRNTTGTFDISDYGHGAGIYAFGIEVTGGTNYNDDSSRFEVYNVDENGNGKSIWETLSLSLAGNPEPAVTAEIVAKPMAMTSSLTVVPFAAPANAMMQTLAIPLFTGAMSTPVSAKAAPAPTALTADSEGSAAMTLSPEEVVLNRGKEFEVTLGLDQAVDVWGILAAVDYDPDTLELLGYTFGDIFTESQFTVQNDRTAAPYKLLATLDEIGTISADGNFVTLKFKVKEDAAEKETTISLQILEAVGETSAVAVGTGGDIRMAVDDSVPAIGGIRDGGTYCPDQLFTVSDANMETVTVNGEVQTAVDGEYALAAGANGQCTIVVTDKAGNSTTYTVTVSHTWASATYAWSGDGKTCTATRVCENDPAHVEIAEATITGEQAKVPDCTKKGETTYTATFTEDWAETQTKTIADVDAAGHTYGDSWTSNETNHWHECACGDKTDVAEHEFVWVTTKEAEIGIAGEKHEECEICGYEKAPVEIPAMAVPNGDENSPTTSDNNHLTLWIALLFVSGGVLGTLTIKRKKQEV